MIGATKVGVQLSPLDTWFFRDGTPFSAHHSAQEAVSSTFPPHPATVAGAVRAWLALSNGWSGQGRWHAEICKVLGDGPDDLGRLSFDGPFVLRCGRPLFRVPRHLLGDMTAPEGSRPRWRPRVLLCPGNPVRCDLGERVRLPRLPTVFSGSPDMKVGDDVWLSADGMRAVLAGRLPENSMFVRSAGIWSQERRIGLKRDPETRTVEEGMLYSSSHVRPGRGVSLGVQVDGVPDSWTRRFGSLVPLGGESRLAEFTKWSGDLSLDTDLEARRRLVLVALTPLDLPQDIYGGRQPLALAGLGDALVVSACLGRPQRIGGWDSGRRRPVPMRSVLAPGSVLFCELPEVPVRGTIPSGGLMRLGTRQEWGFGLVAVGRWPNDEETDS